MAGKRFHYDAKGKLRGYSTDKYRPGMKDVFLIMILGIGASILFPGLNGSDSYKSSESDKISAEGSGGTFYVATGPANIRSKPTTENSRVVGKLASGDRIRGESAGGDVESWVKIVEGPLAGSFVWLRNLRDSAEIERRSEVETHSPGVAAGDAEERIVTEPAPRPQTTKEYLQRTYLNANSSCVTLDTVPFFEKSCREGDEAACATLRCGAEAPRE